MEGDHSQCGVWRLVVMPDGYGVCALPEYDRVAEGAGLFGLAVKGIGEHGEDVVVRGNHIARCWRRDTRTGASA